VSQVEFVSFFVLNYSDGKLDSRALIWPDATMQQIRRRVLITTMLFMASARVASASTLDQAFEPPAGADNQGIIYADPSGVFVNHAQTFTVGILGTLDRVDLLISQWQFPAPLLVDIRPTVDGVPLLDDRSALASTFVLSTAVPQYYPNWVSVDFGASPIAVVPGQQLALVLRTTTAWYGIDYHWLGDVGNQYAGGSAYYRPSLADGWSAVRGGSPAGPLDYGIRTFVTPVPEPKMLSLLSVCATFGLLYSARRRTRTRATPNR